MRASTKVDLEVMVGIALGCLAVGCSAGGSRDDAMHPELTPSSVASTPTVDPGATAVPSATPASTGAPSASSSAAVAPAAAKHLPPGLKILVIGDSFAEALGVGLKAKENDYGIKATLRGEKATFIPEWAGPNRGVPLMLEQVKPQLVVIALGGNELAMTDPSVRGPKVAKLVSYMGQTPCVWVSPPLWDIKDNGLLEVIRKNSGPCRYFDSSVLSPNLPRGSDKIHPTSEGQKIWAKYFLDWLEKEQAGDGSTFALAPRPASE